MRSPERRNYGKKQASLPSLRELREEEDTLDWQENQGRPAKANLPPQVKLGIFGAITMIFTFFARSIYRK